MSDTQTFVVPLWRRWLSGIGLVVFLAVLASLAILFREYNYEAYRHFPFYYVALSIPVAFAVVFLTKLLFRLHPMFKWRPSHLFIRKEQRADEGPTDSMLVKAMKRRFFGPIVTALLLINLPSIAMLEELIFREGTGDWPEAALRSLLFGLAHFLSNMPAGAIVTISLVGAWLSYWYFEGGIALSGTVHFAYIVFIVGAALPTIIRHHLRRK